MPIYDFHCPACGHTFEQLAKMDETPACPACAAPQTERQFSFSAGISTGKTQGRSIKEAKQRRDTRLAANRARELRNYEQDHHDDH